MSACISCAGPLAAARSYSFKSRAFAGVYRDDRVYRCAACGLVQADCSKVDDTALTRYYARDYRAVAGIGVVKNDVSVTYHQQRASALLRLTQSLLTAPPSRVFEFGAGYGFNLVPFRQAYPEVRLYADDLDEGLQQRVHVEPGSLAEGGYDVILLSHVVEHFINPVDLLTRALAALTPNGLIVIEVPNDVAGIVMLNGVDEPHLSFFTEPTLRALLERVPALEIADIFTAGPSYTRRSVRSVLRGALAKALNRSPLRRLLDRRRSHRVAAADFSVRNPHGVYLRAAVRKRAA